MARRAISVAAQVADEAIPARVTRWRQSEATGSPSHRPCSSPLARLAASPASTAPQPIGRKPCSPAEGGAGASSIPANADRRPGRAGAVDRSRLITPRASATSRSARLLVSANDWFRRMVCWRGWRSGPSRRRRHVASGSWCRRGSRVVRRGSVRGLLRRARAARRLARCWLECPVAVVGGRAARGRGVCRAWPRGTAAQSAGATVLLLNERCQWRWQFDRFLAELQEYAFLLEVDLIEPQDHDPCGRLAVEQQQAAADPGWQFERVVVKQVPGLPQAGAVVDRRGAGARRWAHDGDARDQAGSVQPIDESAGRHRSAGHAGEPRIHVALAQVGEAESLSVEPRGQVDSDAELAVRVPVAAS